MTITSNNPNPINFYLGRVWWKNYSQLNPYLIIYYVNKHHSITKTTFQKINFYNSIFT